MLLPPQARFSQRLRNQFVWLDGHEDHIRVLSEEQHQQRLDSLSLNLDDYR
jgi:hypothetical protein